MSSRKRWIRPSVTRRPKGLFSTRALLESLEQRQLLSTNPIIAENQLPGTPQNVWDVVGAGDLTLQGFSTDISANAGGAVQFKINDTQRAPYHIDIYRMGYYQGNGARLVTSIPASQTLDVVQPAPLTDPTTKLIDCGNWSVTASWQVPTTAVSGIYFARLVRDDTGGASRIVFVVRNDASRSDLLFQTSDTTWQAYNTYGGNSLYGTPQAHDLNQRAYAVSYNRPLQLDAGSDGYTDYNSPFHAEYPMVRWLEANGFDVSYFSGVDAARLGAGYIEQHKAYLSVGHDEYWSNQQGANVQAARDAGVNLAFFSGNEHFWETRWGNSIDSSNSSYRTVICYKESYSPGIDPTDPTNWTGTWRDPRQPNGSNAENAITGVMYMDDRTNKDIGIGMTVGASQAGLRFWRDTAVAALQPGQTITIGDRIIGYETDSDVDNGLRPAGLFDLQGTTFTTPSHVNVPWGTSVGPGTSTQNSTLYRAASGALVFGAGTVQWSWGLDGTHNDGSGTADLNIQQATVNLFADMGVQPVTLQPGLKREAMSTDATAPTTALTAPAGGANLSAGTPVTLTGTSVDAGGGAVAGVEVSTDGGLTWHPATGRGTWQYLWTPGVPGPVTVLYRAVDDSGNLELPKSVSFTVQAAATSPTGLVASYNFDQGSGTTLTDNSGHGNTGTISNATWVASGGGRYGGALSFNGGNSIVSIANNSTLQLTTGMTLEAWVRPSALADWGAVIYKPRSSLSLSYGLYATDGVSRPPSGYVNVSTSQSAVDDSAAVGQSVLPLSAWSHLALTYDGATLNFYVNDTLVSSMAVSGSIVTSTNALTIGNDNIGEAFSGLIDDVRIYNRALSPSEIGVDMSTPVGGTPESVPPTGVLTGPTNGSTVAGTTTLAATASDNVAVAGVQFLLNGQPLGGEDTAAPYSLAWNTLKVPNGTYVLSARVRDAAGNVTTLTGSTVTVANPPDVTAPTVRVTGPAAGTTVGGSVALSALAVDNIGVTGVQFQVNGVNVGPLLTGAPYRLSVDAAALGSGPVTITAVAYDAAGNATTSSAVNLTVDATRPVVTAFTPGDGAANVLTDVTPSVTFSKPVLTSSTTVVLKSAGGTVVPGSLVYDDSSDTITFVPDGSLAPSTTYTMTVSGTTDQYGNAIAGATTWSFTTVNSINGATIWSSAEVPSNPSVDDTKSVELGVKFRSDLSGYITGIRFYKGSLNTGAHVAHLWTSTGTLLATGTFDNETASGWQQVNFTTPVAITANTVYVASYFAPNGGYADDAAYFATAGVDSAPLHAPANGVSGSNGLYIYTSAGAFPTQTFNASNYWVEPVFGTTNLVADNTAPTVVNKAPAPGEIEVPTNAVITVTFSESVQPGTVSLALRDFGGNPVTATVTYNDATHTATLTPTAELAPDASYSVAVTGAKDAAGNVMSGTVVWTFVTGESASATTVTLFPGPSAPANPAANDGNAVQVGVKFTSDVNGYIQGIRFYKGPGNSGTHVANLWSGTGALLATATFVSESAAGWQQILFTSAVAITANTVYVASYYAPNGHYASDNGYFATAGVDNGTLHAPSNAAANGNGVYAYGGATTFPNSSYNATNYWVDPVFSISNASSAPPVVTQQTPAPGATGVLPAIKVTVSFSEAVQSSNLSFVLRDGAGNVVPATVTYDGATQTATLVPAVQLAGSTTYTVTVNATGATGSNEDGGGGVPMDAPVTWSFTTSPVVVGSSLWTTAVTPATASVNDTNAVELGLKFTADYDGFISAIRFYKGSLNTGTHVAHLWASDGTLLGTATFANETATGWQVATFATPISVKAGTTYVASYFAPRGGYAMDAGYFATSGVNNGPLHAPSSSSAGGNGVFLYGAAGGFPTGTFNGGNYWVDVVFGTVTDNTAPVVTARTPAAGTTGVALGSPVTVTFDEAVQPGTISLVLKDGGGNVVPGTSAYDSVTRVATFTPAAPLQPGVTYTVNLSGATDVAGNAMTGPLTWTFTTTTAGSATQTTAGDFAAGVPAGTTVTPAGEVELAPAAFDDFAGTSLGSAWTTDSWTSAGGGATAVGVSGGILSVAGAQVVSTATYVGAAVEGSVAFAAAPYQNFGLTTGLATEAGNYWAMFGTAGTSTNLYARVNVGGTLTEVDLGAVPSGFHKYRIQPVAGGFQFLVDGVLQTTVAAAGMPAGTAMNLVASAFTSNAIQVDWMGAGGYTGSGTFTSAVIDAGRSVSWSTIDWNAMLPAGTSVLVETRTGDSAIPDGTWSAWSVATDGVNVGSPAGRYLQYRVTLSTTDPGATPVVLDVRIDWA